MMKIKNYKFKMRNWIETVTSSITNYIYSNDKEIKDNIDCYTNSDSYKSPLDL